MMNNNGDEKEKKKLDKIKSLYSQILNKTPFKTGKLEAMKSKKKLPS